MDFEAVKQRQAYAWGLGDYSVLSRQLAPAALELRDACAVSAGQEVLDVAAGDGNFALACAREGASVVASDISPPMVERGRARSQAEGFEIDWVEADAEALPFEDARFDCVGSVFGAFLAPRPEVMAGELLRVIRPGGTLGMTAWTPQSMMAELFAVGRRFTAPPPDVPLPEQWGDEATARERLEPLATRVDLERRAIRWTAEDAEAFVREMMDTAPAMAAAREALPSDRFEALSGEIHRLAGRWNSSENGGFRIDAEYLVIVARKRG
jgi:ubiquinone/menaquinone biosynthesis C-methylase UbiE